MTPARRIGWMVGASAVIVLVAWLLMSDGGPAEGPAGGGPDAAVGAPASASAPGPQAGPSLGVRQAGVDSAARRGGSESPRGLGLGTAPAKELGPGVSVEKPPPGPAFVSPPIVPSAEAIAESEEILAAQPAAKAALDAWLASRRAAIRTQCWNGDDLPPTVQITLEVTYAEDGGMLARSMSDGGAPLAVSGCVGGVADLVPPRIDPPGITVMVRGVLTLP
jgi:hypothetical protein